MRSSWIPVAVCAAAMAVTAPAAAQDRKVPQDATGKLAEFAGLAWWEPLSYCTAVWSKAAGLTDEPAQKRSYQGKAVSFRHPASLRLAADRGWDHPRALNAIQGRVEHHQFWMRDEDLPKLLARGPDCDGILKRYTAEFP